MNRQQVTRRIILGAFTVALALPGMGAAAEAEEEDSDFYNRAQFKGHCEVDYGGIFTDTEDGNLWCQYPDGSQQVCDSNGNDCWYIPRENNDPFDPSDWGGGDEVADEPSGTESPAPVIDSPTAPDAQPSVAAPDDDQDRDSGKRKGKKGKKGGRGRR